MKKLIIIGAGGHGKVVADIALLLNRYKKIAFLDDNENIKTALSFKVIGKTDMASLYINEYDFFIAVGNSYLRRKFTENLISMGANLATLIHPSAIIGSDVQIGLGTVIMAGAVVNCLSRIGCGCIINTKSSVDHECAIDDYVHLSPGVTLSGNVSVGRGSWLCSGSIISNDLKIVAETIIGAGAVVIKDIITPGVYVGNPAKFIKGI